MMRMMLYYNSRARMVDVVAILGGFVPMLLSTTRSTIIAAAAAAADTDDSSSLEQQQQPQEQEEEQNHSFFVNRTHYGFGEDYIYSTTSPVSLAFYFSIVLVVMIISGSIWIYSSSLSRLSPMLCDVRDSTKKEALIDEKEDKEEEEFVSPYTKVDDLLDKFHFEVKSSEVLFYDEEEQNSYYSNHNPYHHHHPSSGKNHTKNQKSDDTDEDDDSDNPQSTEDRVVRKQQPQRRRRPPVVDGFYSTTHDDLILEYHEDMYLEFIPHPHDDTGYKVQGYGKYNTGNVRVEGLVASTGEAYWYEIPYGTKNNNTNHHHQTDGRRIQMIRRQHHHHQDDDPSSLLPIALARGKFTHDIDTGNVHFVGQWYHSNGDMGGTYRLFSHKVMFPSSNDTMSMTPSMNAESTMECQGEYSISGSLLLLGDDTNRVPSLEEDGCDNTTITSTGQTSVEFGDNGTDGCPSIESSSSSFRGR